MKSLRFHNEKFTCSYIREIFKIFFKYKHIFYSSTGLGRLEKDQSPLDKHLRRLASSLEIRDCRELLIRLGLDTKVLNDVQEKFSPAAFHVNDFKSKAMIIWKESVTDSSFKTIEDAFGEIDKHLLCEVGISISCINS